MKLDFLKEFEKRMKRVGMFTLINHNSFYKNTLKNYGFDVPFESTNLIFTVMLYIMEQSLKEENCTLDDISGFIEDIDKQYFKRFLNSEACKTIADFIVNVILCNSGEAMYFKGYNFEKTAYEYINISLINNRIIYIEDVRRTSYYLTEDGYYLLLGTLEVEGNLKLTVQEMIFKLHLEKADYDKALEDVRQLFNLSRIQLQKIEESIRRIKENVFEFLPEEYDSILNDNMNIIEKQKKTFKGYKDYVSEREKDIEKNNINLNNLNEEDEKALSNLGIIKKQLSRVIDEHQKILNTHFDFKKVYSRALIDMTAFSAIKRINFNNELYEPILRDFGKLEALSKILRPLYLSKLPKYYNIKKAIMPQKVIKAKEEEDELAITFDEDSLKKEREKELKIKQLKYRGVLECIIDFLIVSEDKTITLKEILLVTSDDEDKQKIFVPTIEIFREVMIELLKAQVVDIKEVLIETRNSIENETIIDFELNKTLVAIVIDNERLRSLKTIECCKDPSNEQLQIYDAKTNEGYRRNVKCSNLIFRASI